MIQSQLHSPIREPIYYFIIRTHIRNLRSSRHLFIANCELVNKYFHKMQKNLVFCSQTAKLPPEMNSIQIIKRLEAHGLTRKQIAEQLGVSVTTVNGWMAPNAPRPVPTPAAKLLEKIWTEQQSNGELRFSYPEMEIIQKAIPVSGCKTFNEFAHNTIIAKARELTKTSYLDAAAEPDSLRVAEEETPYNVKKK